MSEGKQRDVGGTTRGNAVPENVREHGIFQRNVGGDGAELGVIPGRDPRRELIEWMPLAKFALLLARSPVYFWTKLLLIRSLQLSLPLPSN